MDIKKTIVWDVDDVLNNLMEEWLNFYNSRNHTNFCYKQLTENPPHKILGITKEKYLNSLDTFRNLSYQFLSPNAMLLKWFKNQGYKFYNIALTSTPLYSAELSAYWVMKYFGEYIREFVFIPSKRNNKKHTVYYETKADWIYRRGGIDFFIDDNENNINQVVRMCNNVSCDILQQPWNNGNRIEKILNNLIRSI